MGRPHVRPRSQVQVAMVVAASCESRERWLVPSRADVVEARGWGAPTGAHLSRGTTQFDPGHVRLCSECSTVTLPEPSDESRRASRGPAGATAGSGLVGLVEL